MEVSGQLHQGAEREGRPRARPLFWGRNQRVEGKRSPYERGQGCRRTSRAPRAALPGVCHESQAHRCFDQRGRRTKARRGSAPSGPHDWQLIDRRKQKHKLVRRKGGDVGGVVCAERNDRVLVPGALRCKSSGGHRRLSPRVEGRGDRHYRLAARGTLAPNPPKNRESRNVRGNGKKSPAERKAEKRKLLWARQDAGVNKKLYRGESGGVENPGPQHHPCETTPPSNRGKHARPSGDRTKVPGLKPDALWLEVCRATKPKPDNYGYHKALA